MRSTWEADADAAARERERPGRKRPQKSDNGEPASDALGGGRDKFSAEEPTEADFEAQTLEERQRFFEQARLDFFAIVDDFLRYANLSAERFRDSSTRHERWRKWYIVATGGLAGINGIAAFDLIVRVKLGGEPVITLAQILTALAAIYAVILTIFSNLENLFNAGEKAAGFRQSRDLFLSVYRDYLQKWLEYVEAFGYTPRACVNAARLYRNLVQADIELRAKVKELTEVQPRGLSDSGPSTSGTGR